MNVDVPHMYSIYFVIHRIFKKGESFSLLSIPIKIWIEFELALLLVRDVLAATRTGVSDVQPV